MTFADRSRAVFGSAGRRLSAATAFAFALACSTRPPAETETFVVRPEAPPVVAAPAGAPRLRLAEPEIASHIRGFGFVDAEGRVSTYVLARPAAPIGEILVDAAVDRWRAAGRFATVLPPTHPARADLVLRLRLRRFEIDASGGGYEAVVRLEGTLDPDGSRDVRAAFAAEGRAVPSSTSPADVVRALEAALARALDAALAETAVAPPATR
jgi:ABC-type uncharacterized transport system auxiliary subunit